RRTSKMTVRVKICGIMRIEDAPAAIAAGADMIGLNFYARSPRYVQLDRAREIREAVGSRAASLDMLQFSGDEDDAALAGWPVPSIVTKRLKLGEVSSVMPHRADYVLFD